MMFRKLTLAILT